MADTNPEDEIGDIKCPVDRIVGTPDPYTGGDQIGGCEKAAGEQSRRDEKGGPPPAWRGLLRDGTDLMGECLVSIRTPDQGYAGQRVGERGGLAV
jgi:hypothetical protein